MGRRRFPAERSGTDGLLEALPHPASSRDQHAGSEADETGVALAGAQPLTPFALQLRLSVEVTVLPTKTNSALANANPATLTPSGAGQEALR